MSIEDAIREKAFAAEKHVALVRLAIVAFNTVIYTWVMDQTGTMPLLAYGTISVAWLYCLYVYFFQPYRRFPVLLSSYFTTISDAALICVWIYATGGVFSPFYVLIYPA